MEVKQIFLSVCLTLLGTCHVFSENPFRSTVNKKAVQNITVQIGEKIHNFLSTFLFNVIQIWWPEIINSIKTFGSD